MEIQNITDKFTITNPVLKSMNDEADEMQRFLSERADLTDPCALTTRLNEMDVYMSRLTDMQIKSRAMKDYAKAIISAAKDRELPDANTTMKNRIVNAELFEFNLTADRLETMYKTMSTMSDHLVTQISYIKKQMEMH